MTLYYATLSAISSQTEFTATSVSKRVSFPACEPSVSCFLQQVTQLVVTPPDSDLEGYGRGDVRVVISSYTVNNGPEQPCDLQHLGDIKDVTSVTFTLNVAAAMAQAMALVLTVF